MFFVKTKIGMSKIQGIGVFADQFIPKGTLVQKFIAGVDVEITPEQFAVLSDIVKGTILHYAYRHKKARNYILPSDDVRFLNHSENPNLISTDSREEIDIASRDIQKGEELTANYRDFDADWNKKLRR